MGYFSNKREKEAGHCKSGIGPERRDPAKSAVCSGCSDSAESGVYSGCSDSAKSIYGCAGMGMLPTGELSEERDFRMLQGMYPNAAKELLDLIEEECDRLEYEGSPMFDEYPDHTAVYTIQKKIARAAYEKSGTPRGAAKADTVAGNGDAFGTVPEDLIRVMLLQEMHRRRTRHGACRGVNAL